MDSDFAFLGLFFSALRLSTPLLFAGFGGLLSERSGVVNIALEGFLLVGAFAAAAATYLTGNPWLGILAALGSGVLIGACFAFLTISIRGNHVIMGTAINLLVIGLLPIVSKLIFEVSGTTPTIPIQQKISVWFFFALAVALGPLLHFILQKTGFGLRLRACGENIEATKSVGISVKRIRYTGVILSGVLASLGGAFLSIAHGSQFVRNMSAGRGFIALAALILAGWKPLPLLATAFIFGLADAAQIILQSYVLPGGYSLPVQWIQMFPYVVTLIVLVFFLGRSELPSI